MANSNTAKKLTGGIVTIVILSICLCITTFALVMANVSVKNNFFGTGEVSINLNDGKPIIYENEFLFEPGMTVEKDFFIESNSSWDVYYRIYFNDVSGGLSDILQITIKDGDKVLYTGTARELTRNNVVAADDVLRVNQKKILTAIFYFPEGEGNRTQDLDMSFTICAEATQTKNNPNRLFD